MKWKDLFTAEKLESTMLRRKNVNLTQRLSFFKFVLYPDDILITRIYTNAHRYREEYNKLTALDLWGRFKQRRKSRKKVKARHGCAESIDLGILSRQNSTDSISSSSCTSSYIDMDGLQQQLRVSKDLVAELKNENDRRRKQLDGIQQRYEGQVLLLPTSHLPLSTGHLSSV